MLGLISVTLPGSALAATLNVTTTADDFNLGSATCSLREAIWAANNDSNAMAPGCRAGSGADVINLPGGVYVLDEGPAGDNLGATGDLDVSADLTIRRLGSASATIDAHGLDRVIEVLPADSLTVDGLTVRGGLLTGGVGGGGGISKTGSGSLTVRNSTIAANNTTAGEGGGILTSGTSVTIENSTISGNRASSDGGGILSAATTTSLRNVTVTGNVADQFGPGGATGDGGGIKVARGIVSLVDTIVAGNSDASEPAMRAPDCAGAPVSGGSNLIGDPTGCAFGSKASDITGVDPSLGSLADNGGPTFTHALLAGSPAIDRGSSAAPGVDQRGAPRRAAPDIGAYERISCRGVLVNRIGTDAGEKLVGTAGSDGMLGLGGSDALLGGLGGDALCGGAGPDRLVSGRGNDRLDGGAGRDRLVGGRGNDRLFGGPGPDLLLAGFGRDLLVGQGGRDRCVGGPGIDRAKGCERRRKVP